MKIQLNGKLRRKSGFTLIEMSIVLVIIGLLVGGVLVGQDLVRAAGVRAEITQIEKYNQATNTFRAKYGALPGDLSQPIATQFGFAARGNLEGQGDNNGIIEGYVHGTDISGLYMCAGETLMFWQDLSQVGLIEGGFNSASSTQPVTTGITGPLLNPYIPTAKIGNNNYVTVFSWNGVNYFAVNAVCSICNLLFQATATLTPRDAYAMDTKIDDGFPQSGNVQADMVFGNGVYWATGLLTTNQGLPVAAVSYVATPYTTPIFGAAYTCYDNSTTGNGTPGISGATQHYSVEINGGSMPTCALSFRCQ